jgi:hypothetical protein
VGAGGPPEDTPPTRFGTVRPRVQIPGPPTSICIQSRLPSLYGLRLEGTAVSQIFKKLPADDPS